MSLLIISTSLNPDSNSRVLALEAQRHLQTGGHTVEFLDMRELPLPFCDGSAAYSHANVAKATALISAADGILLATPIYNYDASAVAKNLVELTGKAWENKTVAFACAAGGASSYMSIMALASSLMLDFRCTIVPRFVYSTEQDFAAGRMVSAKVAARTADLVDALARYARALHP